MRGVAKLSLANAHLNFWPRLIRRVGHDALLKVTDNQEVN
jgi:hypothetical protein